MKCSHLQCTSGRLLDLERFVQFTDFKVESASKFTFPRSPGSSTVQESCKVGGARKDEKFLFQSILHMYEMRGAMNRERDTGT